jgi:tRNA uridine 5-carboxymethylaminomethyl modification enzyme
MLNSSKGPAVHSLRAQADKTVYHIEMKKVVENQEKLDLMQAEAIALIVEEKRVRGVVTSLGAQYEAKAVILATGTYLGGKIFIGSSVFNSGPNGLAASEALTDNLRNLGIRLRRFKTGTPARINKRTLNTAAMTIQWGDEERVPFSFMNDHLEFEELPCYLSYTNESTHGVILENITRSAMFSGEIEGTGPRYCPSIEDKITRFADKNRHQLFVEPEGKDTNEMYVQGMSTSLPLDVQVDFMRTIPGLENVEVMRPAYAIEYDCIDPTTLRLSLELKDIENLFACGQFNGSSGYEEAAAQGLLAGVNAVRKLEGLEPLILDRSQGYIGVLIDDLVTKGTNEPYRMMTSRAEYRLVLRQDNADQRLTPLGYEVGLVTEERYQRYLKKMQLVEEERKRLEETLIKPADFDRIVDQTGSAPIHSSQSLAQLMKRTELNYTLLGPVDVDRPSLPVEVWRQCETEIKYEGYIDKQNAQIKKFKSLEKKLLPDDLNYGEIDGLRIEAKQKLTAIRPKNIGQASRISGVSPADISVLMVALEQRKRRRHV